MRGWKSTDPPANTLVDIVALQDLAVEGALRDLVGLQDEDPTLDPTVRLQFESLPQRGICETDEVL